MIGIGDSEPVQDYADPLNAHLGYDAGNTWGAWDLVFRYAWDKGSGHAHRLRSGFLAPGVGGLP
jgi:hypothetical protein